MTKIRNAGAIFIGEYSSEDRCLEIIFAGPNHVLPGGTAFFSPLSVDDFIKKSSIIAYSGNALEKIQSMRISRTLPRRSTDCTHKFHQSLLKSEDVKYEDRDSMSVKRTTKETDIEITLNLDGTGKKQIFTPVSDFRPHAGWICASQLIRSDGDG